MRARNLTLYIPGLFGAAAWRDAQPFQGLELAELELLLSRARQQRRSERGFEDTMFDLFGHSATNQGASVAALTYLCDQGRSPDKSCLRADPVNLIPDRDKVVMIGNRHLAISKDEAQQLAQTFNKLFAEDGLRLEVPQPQRWYLLLDQETTIQTTPLKQVIGQDIHPNLPQGQDAMRWHAILNEIQMLFYTHPVNERRRQRGQPEINSIWLWGEGVMPNLPEQRWQQVWSNEVLSHGLALTSKTALASLPATAEEWLEQAEQGGEHLVVLEALNDTLEQHDLQRWREMLETINDEWMRPLIEALRTNTIANLYLLTDSTEFEINAKRLKHWWKRRRPMSAI